MTASNAGPSFFQMLEIDYAVSREHPTALSDLRRGNLNAVIIRNVYSASAMAQIAARLEQHNPPFVRTTFPEKFNSWFYGRNLNLLDTDPWTYFSESSLFHHQLEELFADGGGYRARILPLLSTLDGGLRYTAAPGPEPDLSYMLTTIRGHATGGYIPLHCDNEQALRPSYEHLETLVHPETFSLVLTIQPALHGGELEVFDYSVSDTGTQLMNDDAAPSYPPPESMDSVTVAAGAGDLVLCRSGTELHRVTPVGGARTRWVTCSFMAAARDRDAVYSWG